MKKETIKKIGNTLVFSGVTGLAVWKTWEVWSLKNNMGYYAEALKEVKDLIKEANRCVVDVRFPICNGVKNDEEDLRLRKAEHNFALSCGTLDYLIESIEDATSD